ncbi:hypothetical protein J2857_005216 [Neorhizobium galegae]|uniref:hypothetical protein n=1 Tax=Neorhizobium galegae TaxID=399 RepID=UPI001AEA3D3B|nr:hypothetical protein [Neorhizobium galegae]MBP2562425.1 hypothetical protein [Neorhizobium galegae]
MTYRKLLLVACAGTGLLAAVGSLAMPAVAPKIDTGTVPAGYDERDDDGHHEGHRRHGDDHGRQASSDGCPGDDDDNGACGGRGGAMQQQNVTPPANGLFTSGSTPRAQMN